MKSTMNKGSSDIRNIYYTESCDHTIFELDFLVKEQISFGL